MLRIRGTEVSYKISFILMTLGFFWLWTFNRNPHVLIKYFSHQGYIFTWVYFLAMMMEWPSIIGYSTKRLFQINFVLQVMISLAYWLMIHNPSVKSGKISSSNIWWNIYIHTLPLALLLYQILTKKFRLSNCWKDTQYLYFFFSFPINFAYSTIHKPVYPFLRYQSIWDFFKILIGALLLYLIQQAQVAIFNQLSHKIK